MYRLYTLFRWWVDQINNQNYHITGIQDFKLGGGGALKKNCAERKEARKYFGYFVWKITILRQKIIFFRI